MGLPLFRQFSPGLQVMFFLVLHFLGYGVAQAFAFLIARPFWGVNLLTHPGVLEDLSDPSILSLHRVILILLALFAFITPVFVFRRFMELPDQDYLFIRKGIGWKEAMMMIGVFVMAYPVVNLIFEWNMLIDLPGLFGETGTRMVQIEQETQAYSMFLLSDPNTGIFLINLLIIGLLTALGEELFFRSVMLRLFSKAFRNVHIAVWAGAFFFSLYHFQFQGFLPRLFMGALLGYIFMMTGTIWSTVLIHFLNNATVVAMIWLKTKGYSLQNLNDFGRTGAGAILAAILLPLLVALWVYFWKRSRSHQVSSETLYR